MASGTSEFAFKTIARVSVLTVNDARPEEAEVTAGTSASPVKSFTITVMLSGNSWALNSPEGVVALWMLTYRPPASSESYWAWVKVLEIEKLPMLSAS